ncbi:MAG: tRNA dihydrouridine synthase DusB [Clostridia bacterium]|nr:tRNA dihydrouridine synthase DusB [Clostridia bacterium]
MKIGKTEIHGIAALAPMAGVADRAFRELCVGYGASYCVGEMASSKGLIMHDRKSAQLLEVTEPERPMAVQLFGSDPDIMAQSVEKALRYSPDAIDINMGCPTPKITNNGTGSALMKNPELCGRIIEAVKAAAGDTPVTAKIRKGWDNDSINAVEVAGICEQAGAAAITIHARTRAQMYAPPADWDIIAAVKRAVSVPVIGNGDIFCAEDAMRMLEQTGCDMIMIGRAALGNPWIFRAVNALYEQDRPLPEPGVFERMTVMRRHIAKLCEYKGEYVGMREARKHAAWYMRGMRGAAKLRGQCASLNKLEDVDALIRLVLENAAANGDISVVGGEDN